jgi:hypothetical protein
MTGSLSSLLFILAFGCSAAVASVEVTPHEISPPLDKMEADGVGYEEPAPVAVSAAPLAKPSADDFGTLTEASAGLPTSVWQLDSRAEDDFLLAQINSGIANDTLRDLLARLLMLQAPLPPGTSGSDWLLERVTALADTGQDDKVLEMIAALPASIVKPQLTALQTEIQLAHADYDIACRHAAPDTHVTDVFWQKLNVLCEARLGKHDEAMVGLDVLHESDADDLFFQEAVRHMMDKNIPIKSMPKKFSLLDFAMLRLAGETDKLRDKIDTLPPIAIKYLAKDATVDIKLREKATAAGQQMGLIAGAEGKLPEPAFAKPLASDVTTLVAALESGAPPTDTQNAVIAKLAIDNVDIQDSRRLQRLLGIMELFGYKVPSDVWRKLSVHKNRFDGEVPTTMLLDRFTQARIANRKAEIILLSALITGSNELYKTSDMVLIPVVAALKSAGFEKEARAVAVASVKGYK